MNPYIRILPTNIQILPYQPQFTPKEPDKGKQDEQTLVSLIQRIHKDKHQNLKNTPHNFKKKKKQSENLHDILDKFLPKEEKDSSKKKLKNVSDIKKNLKKKLQKGIQLMDKLLHPLKTLLKTPHPESEHFSLHHLQLSTEMIQKIRKDLLNTHQDIDEKLASIHHSIIAHTHYYLLELQTLIENDVPSLHPLFQLLKTYEEKYALYQSCILYIEKWLHSCEQDQLLNFFMKQTEKQFQQIENSPKNQYTIACENAESQLKFLEQIAKVKPLPSTSCKEHAFILSSEKPELHSQVHESIHHFKTRLKQIKKDLKSP